MKILLTLTAVVIVLGYVTLISWMAIFEFGPIPLGYWVFLGCMAIIITLFMLLQKEY